MNPTTAESIYRRDNWTCQYCALDGRGSFTAWRSLSFDYLLPPGHARRDDPDFIVIACSHCNIMLAPHFKSVTARGETFASPKREALLKARRDFLTPRLDKLRAYWQRAKSSLTAGLVH
jgi:hypothetical protein